MTCDCHHVFSHHSIQNIVDIEHIMYVEACLLGHNWIHYLPSMKAGMLPLSSSIMTPAVVLQPG